MKKYAVILAGGSGLRAGGDMPKQFRPLLGIPLLWWSVRAFYQEDPQTRISVVLHPGYFDWWDIFRSELPEEDRAIEVRLVCGGPDRPHSVLNGITGLAPDEDAYVAVHDGARPLVTPRMIRDGWEAGRRAAAAYPCVPVTDSLREKDPATGMARPVDRSRFVAVQTPQVARLDVLRRAFGEADDPSRFTDDASLVEACGVTPAPFPGDPENIKVTNPLDFRVAEALLSAR